MSDISLKDIEALIHSGKLSETDLRVLEAQLTKLEKLKDRELAQTRFIKFVEKVWPTFISGRHHKRMAEAFERVANGTCKRLIINMPPRHTKSEFASYLLPAWFLGRFPHKKVIQASHTAELAVGFGRKVRNLVDSEVYHDIFPELSLQSDSKAAGRWNTSKGGDYFAIGVGGAVTGKGADVLIIDDPHSEQEAAMAASNPEVYDKVIEWYTSGPRQRLQPGGSIGIVFWSMEELEALRNELPNAKWQAQYQQNPVGNESAIVKRDWWKIWEEDRPPACEYILQTWDTAFEKNNRADYSAGTTWGIFKNDEDYGNSNIILLNTYKKRVEYPDLKRDVLKEYNTYEPDGVLIEKKASGAPLIYDLRAMGIPVQEFTPGKGQDKVARLNAVSDIIASGKVWVPNTRWAEELVDEIAEFPSGEHDDLVDATTLALMRFRQGGFLRLPSDEPEDIRYFKGHRAERYYTV